MENPVNENKETVSNLVKTIRAYESGEKHLAYNIFLQDPTRRRDIGFWKFCEGMENIIKAKR